MLDPLPIAGFWPWLLIPLALGISVAYKAVRVSSRDKYVKSVILMASQIVIAMVVLSAVTYLFVWFVVPQVTPISP